MNSDIAKECVTCVHLQEKPQEEQSNGIDYFCDTNKNSVLRYSHEDDCDYFYSEMETKVPDTISFHDLFLMARDDGLLGEHGDSFKEEDFPTLFIDLLNAVYTAGFMFGQKDFENESKTE